MDKSKNSELGYKKLPHQAKDILGICINALEDHKFTEAVIKIGEMLRMFWAVSTPGNCQKIA